MPDTVVLIDVIEDDPRWAAWSKARLEEARAEGRVVLNPVVYAELAPGFSSPERLDSILLPSDLEREAIPWPAAFLAGRVFADYRRRGGRRVAPLPDFFIGAHAAVMGYGLITRDSRRYRTYFPTLTIVAP